MSAPAVAALPVEETPIAAAHVPKTKLEAASVAEPGAKADVAVPAATPAPAPAPENKTVEEKVAAVAAGKWQPADCLSRLVKQQADLIGWISVCRRRSRRAALVLGRRAREPARAGR